MKKFLLILFLNFFMLSCNTNEHNKEPKSAEEYYEFAIKEYSAQNYSDAKKYFNELKIFYPNSNFIDKSNEYIQKIFETDKKQISEICKNISLQVKECKNAIETDDLLNKIEAKYQFFYLYTEYSDIKDYINEIREQIKNDLKKELLKNISVQIKNCRTATETEMLLKNIENKYKNSYLYEENSDVKKYVDKTKKEIKNKLNEEKILNELGIELLDLKTGWRCGYSRSNPMVIMKIKNVGIKAITNLEVRISFELGNERIGDENRYVLSSKDACLQPSYVKSVSIYTFDYEVDYLNFTNVIAHIYIGVSTDDDIKGLYPEMKLVKTVKIRPIKLIDD